MAKKKNKRIPRKKGQRQNSPSHSDLFTDENEEGTIPGLKFATVKDSEASVRKIKRSGKSHNHKTQAAIAMEQRAESMGKKSAAAVFRRFIEDQKEITKNKNRKKKNESYLRQLVQRIIIEEIQREDFEDVMQTARLAHLGQRRRDGTEYIMHPIAVQKITEKHYPENFAAHILALLHDTIEDGPLYGNATEQELRQMIRGSITDPRDLDKIEIALNLMTHDKATDPDYNDYLAKVFSNKLASIVKISDLIHNLSHNPSNKQIAKYKNAIKDVGIPAWIRKSQLDELMGILNETTSTG